MWEEKCEGVRSRCGEKALCGEKELCGGGPYQRIERRVQYYSGGIRGRTMLNRFDYGEVFTRQSTTRQDESREWHAECRNSRCT